LAHGAEGLDIFVAGLDGARLIDGKTYPDHDLIFDGNPLLDEHVLPVEEDLNFDVVFSVMELGSLGYASLRPGLHVLVGMWWICDESIGGRAPTPAEGYAPLTLRCTRRLRVP
jgi:hypothetical protein